MKRREFITLLGGTAAWPFAARAQQAGRLPRVGFLSQGAGLGAQQSSFFEELRALGWIDGQNYTVDYRFAAGRLDQLAAMAADLVRLNVNVIVTAATPAAKAAQSATRTIPIVIADPGDPVELGLVASLARPGGNITGQVSIAPDLAAKRLELLKKSAPTVSRVAVIWNSAIPPAEVALKELQAAAAILKIDIHPAQIREPREFENVVAMAVRDRAVNALMVFPDPVTFENKQSIVNIANEKRLPAMFGARDFVDVGGLLSYGPSYPDIYRRAGNYVSRILKGTKPADLPVEQPTKFDLVMNMKTAKTLGLTIPPMFLALVDAAIE